MGRKSIILIMSLFVVIIFTLSVYPFINKEDHFFKSSNNLNSSDSYLESYIKFPEYLSKEIEDSASFETAKQLNAVVVINGEVITSGDLIYLFMEEMKENKEAELYHYNFDVLNNDQYTKEELIVTRFYKQDDTLYKQVSAAVSEVNGKPWNQIPEILPSSTRKLDSLELNPYGTLIYTSEDIGSEEYSEQVINKRELFDDWGERLRLIERYMDVLVGSGNLQIDWESPKELKDLFFLFEDIYSHNTVGRLNEHFEVKPGDWVVIPIVSIEKTLSSYFDGFTRELIIDSSQAWYDNELDAIVYGGGRGGEPPRPFVTYYKKSDQILTIDYILLNPNEVPINNKVHRLTIELKPDGSFLYRSNRLVE